MKTKREGADEPAAWDAHCKRLLNLDETITRNSHEHSLLIHTSAPRFPRVLSRAAPWARGIALSSLLSRQSSAATLATSPGFSGAGQARHLPAHDGGRPTWTLRSQARAQQVRRQPAPAEIIRASSLVPDGQGIADGIAYQFAKHGQWGWSSPKQVPHIASVADELTMVRTWVTDEFNHANAQLLTEHRLPSCRATCMARGSPTALARKTRTCRASSFSRTAMRQPTPAIRCGRADLCPPRIRASLFRAAATRCRTLAPARTHRHAALRLHRRHHEAQPRASRRCGRSRDRDPHRTIRAGLSHADERAGLDGHFQKRPKSGDVWCRTSQTSFANNCLTRASARRARRAHGAGLLGGWDAHQQIYNSMPRLCRQMDLPVAALIRDLKQRGLLDDTLVVWAGEFGRTPMVQDVSPDGMTNAMGRDHHKDAFTVLVAGGVSARPDLRRNRRPRLSRRERHRPRPRPASHAAHQLGLDHEHLTLPVQAATSALPTCMASGESAAGVISIAKHTGPHRFVRFSKPR